MIINELISASREIIQAEDYSDSARDLLRANLEAAQLIKGVTAEQLHSIGSLIEAYEVARSVAEASPQT